MSFNFKWCYRFRVLFAADEFNGFFWTTSLKNPETNDWLKPRELSLVHYFEKLFKPNSGLVSINPRVNVNLRNVTPPYAFAIFHHFRNVVVTLWHCQEQEWRGATVRAMTMCSY